MSRLIGLLAEDEAPQREALSELLAALWPDLDLRVCEDGLSALEVLQTCPEDEADVGEQEFVEILGDVQEAPAEPGLADFLGRKGQGEHQVAGGGLDGRLALDGIGQHRISSGPAGRRP